MIPKEIIELFEQYEIPLISMPCLLYTSCKGEYGILGRRFFMKGGDLRTHHVHIFAEESRKEIERHLAVRDYLRTHKKDAEVYAALKTELAEKFTYDNEGYCDGKDSFVKDLERKALEWRKIMYVSEKNKTYCQKTDG